MNIIDALHEEVRRYEHQPKTFRDTPTAYGWCLIFRALLEILKRLPER